MLLKFLPMSHRTVIFIAVFYTGTQLIGWKYGTPLRPTALFLMLFFWGMVVFQALQRRNPGWQSASAFGGPNLIDVVGAWFDGLSASVKLTYWLVVIIAAIVIYRVF